MATGERRALELYRRFAERFAADPEAARLWVELSNAEAAHYAILRLAADTVRREGAAEALEATSGDAADAMEGTLAILESRAAAGALPLAEAVQAALTLEQEELPRIRHLLGVLPPAARGSILAGIVLGLPAHYACLAKLAARPGIAGAAAALQALTEEARRLATAA